MECRITEQWHYITLRTDFGPTLRPVCCVSSAIVFGSNLAFILVFPMVATVNDRPCTLSCEEF